MLDHYASPTFADIDGDGDLDLYVGNSHGEIKLFTNTDGIFNPTAITVQANGSDLDVGLYAIPEFGDIDGDGDLDLYVGGSNYPDNTGEISVFTNDNGVFTAAGSLDLTGSNPISNYVGQFASPRFADIDGDDDLDIYSGSSDGFITWFSNTNGVFTSEGRLQSNLNIDIKPGLKSNPTFNDADGDGDLDLYVNAGDNIYLYTNNTGVFTDAGKVQTNGLIIDTEDFAAPVFADIDADGDLDLYVGNEEGYIKVFNNTNGVFTEVENLKVGTVTKFGTYTSPTFADIDR